MTIKPLLIKFKQNFRWFRVPLKQYKPDGTTFKDITRQTILDEDLPGLNFSPRYFEIKAGGYSSLEKHQHVHVVFVLRGKGRVLLGAEVKEVAPFDCLYIPPDTWHQFQPLGKKTLGLLCFVDKDRDRPQLPSADDLEELRQNEAVEKFIKA
ncbi:cupin domain-containing protein [Candidatus Margulisiibacteriota bacterium]